MGVCGNPVCLEPKFFASLAQVIYTCNSRKHTVDFAERARRACPDEQFVGFASRGNSKAVVAPTRGEAIEMLRIPVKVEHQVMVYRNGNELHSITVPGQTGIFVGNTFDQALGKLKSAGRLSLL